MDKSILLQPKADEMPDNDKVICPKCCHQFRAIPVNVQAELSRAEPLTELAVAMSAFKHAWYGNKPAATSYIELLATKVPEPQRRYLTEFLAVLKGEKEAVYITTQDSGMVSEPGATREFTATAGVALGTVCGTAIKGREGMVSVPLEPTAAMLKVCGRAWSVVQIKELWRAMLEAAPK